MHAQAACIGMREIVQRLTGHRWSEIGATHADVDDVPHRPPAVTTPVPGMQARHHVGHAAALALDRRSEILAIHQEGTVRRHAQRHVQGGLTFGVVDLGTGKEAIDPAPQVNRTGQRMQAAEGIVGDPLARQVKQQWPGTTGKSLRTLRICREQGTQMLPAGLARMGSEGMPLGKGVDGHGGSGVRLMCCRREVQALECAQL